MRSDFTATANAIAATTKKSEKERILADYVRSLDDASLERAAVLAELIGPQVQEVTWRLWTIRTLLQLSRTNSEMKTAHSVAVEQCVPLARLLGEIRKTAGDERCPLHADEAMTVGRFLIPDIPIGSQPQVVMEAAQLLHNRYQPLSDSIHARLCVLAEKVEVACGFAPLPDSVGVEVVAVPGARETVDAAAARE